MIIIENLRRIFDSYKSSTCLISRNASGWINSIALLSKSLKVI